MVIHLQDNYFHAVTYKTVPLFRDLPQLFHDPAAQGIDIHRFLDIQQFKYFINIADPIQNQLI